MKSKKILIFLLIVPCFFYADFDPFKSQQEKINEAYSRYQKNKNVEKDNSFLENWIKAFEKTKDSFAEGINFLGSVDGAEAVIDTALTAYIYFIMYLQQSALDSGLQQEGLQIFYPGDIKITLSDVAGLSGAKADVQDIITYLKNPNLYKNIGARVPKGVLMNGSPGNGKTMLARAVAGTVNCPFISINGSAFIQMYIGLGALRVRRLFKQARSLAKIHGACIIFIDEIDAIALQRSSQGSGGHNEHDQTLNALLAEMDGLDQSNNPVIIIGATNRAHLLDEAIVRPGRFDRKVEVAKLNVKDRLELLQLAIKKIKIDNSFDLHRIARFTRGFSGAEIANLMNEGAILAANAGKDFVSMQDIEYAFDNIIMGREILGMEQSDEKKWKTAIHEAGHTIATLLCEVSYAVHKVSILPRSNTLGAMYKLPLYEVYEQTQCDMENDIIVALCGRIAEEEFGMGLGTGAASDLQTAYKLAYDMVAVYGMSEALKNISYNQRYQLPNDIGTQVEREIEKIITRCTEKGKQLITSHKKEIEAIALLLFNKGTVLGYELYELLGMKSPVMAQIA